MATEKILTIAEVWPKTNKNPFRRIKIGFFIVAVIMFNISVLVEFRNLILINDYEALSMHLSTLGLYLGYTIKIIIFYYNEEGFNDLLAYIDSPIFDEFPSELQKHKDRCISMSNRVAIFYLFCVGSCTCLYLNKPFYTDYPLPISFSYELNSVTYVLVLTLQCFTCYYLVMIGVCFDVLNIGLINIATAKLDILSERIVTFKPKNPTLMLEEEQAFLIKCINVHQAILRFVGKIEDIFSYLFLTQCLASVTSISNSIFQLTHTEKLISIHFMLNCCFAFNVLFEVWIYCWFAGDMTIKSLKIGDACYHFNWLNSSTRTKKLLLIILCRSQSPLYITAGKFVRLSLSTFLSMLKMAYSYFALMQSLYDKKNDQ